MDNVKGLLQRGTSTFSEFTAGQKAVSVLGLIALVVGGLFFSRWASTPTYTPLFSNIASTDASAIVEKLNETGTPYELVDGGTTIMVPRDRVYDVRLQMSGEGLPAGEQTGYSLLDKQGITASEFKQRVDYQRAIEGELNKTIESIDGVETAVVRIVVPEKDVFADEDGKPTASVLLGTQMGSTLASPQVRAVVHLVASSVEGLSPDNVTVADSTGKLLSGSGQGGGGVGAATEREEQTQAYQARLQNSVQTMLEKVVGPGKAVVTVTADLDFDAAERRTESYQDNPKVRPIAEQNSKETYDGAGGTPTGGVLGPDNIAVPNGTGNGTGKYVKESRTLDNPVGKVTEVRTAAPGTVKRLNVAVLLDTGAAGNVDPAAVTKLVSAGVGIDVQRGDTIEVNRLAFNTDAATAAQKALEEAKKAEERAGMMQMAKTGGLSLLVGLMVLIAWLKSRKKKGSEAQRVELELLEAERAKLEQARQRLAVEHAENMLALESVAVTPSAAIADEMKNEITDLVERQPDEVAALLRGWLADRRT